MVGITYFQIFVMINGARKRSLPVTVLLSILRVAAMPPVASSLKLQNLFLSIFWLELIRQYILYLIILIVAFLVNEHDNWLLSWSEKTSTLEFSSLESDMMLTLLHAYTLQCTCTLTRRWLTVNSRRINDSVLWRHDSWDFLKAVIGARRLLFSFCSEKGVE